MTDWLPRDAPPRPFSRPRLALKIDVDSLHGARAGVPRLLELLGRQQAKATFLFAFGPDDGAGAVAAALQPLDRRVRAAWMQPPEGLGARLRQWVPARSVGRAAAQALRAVLDAGHEVGLRGWSPTRWRRRIASADARWTGREMERAVECFRDVVGAPPRAHGAAGWQMNRHALRLTQRLGFSYCSDARGSHPFVPVYDAELIGCRQIPTTLPTLDEVVGVEHASEFEAVLRLLALTARGSQRDAEVFNLRAEIEGLLLAPALARLLDGWQAQGFELVALRTLADAFPAEMLPKHEVRFGSVSGRAGTVLMQGPAFPGDDARLPAGALPLRAANHSRTGDP